MGARFWEGIWKEGDWNWGMGPFLNNWKWVVLEMEGFKEE